jgi:hypothetical protein
MTPRLAAWGCCFLGGLLAAASAAGAQSPREVRVEAGVAELQQLGRDTRAAALLGASWRRTEARLATIIAGSASWARDSVAAFQSVGALIWRSSAESRFSTELGATGAAFGISKIGRGGNASAYLRQRVAIGNGGVWGGAAFGSSVRDELVSHATGVDLGAWGQLGALQGSVSVARYRTDDWPLFEASRIFLSRAAASYDVNDATVALHYERGNLTLDAAQSWRTGTRATDVTQSALTGAVAWALSRRYALTLSAGRQLADAVRGTPDARIVTAALRMTWASVRESDDDYGASSYVRVVPGEGGGTLFIHVSAPEEAIVTVAGSFSDWEPVQLRRVADGWEAERFLKSGRYRVAVKIDNGPWRSPGNLAKMKDEFDGQNGLIIIP